MDQQQLTTNEVEHFRALLLKAIEKRHTDAAGTGNFCYVAVEKQLAVVRLNESGYFPMSDEYFLATSPDAAKAEAKELNQKRLGILPARQTAILVSSLSATSMTRRKWPNR